MKKKPFIRHFGSVNQRKAGGTSKWSAEEFFCNAHLSIRYHDLHKQGFQLNENEKSTIINCYRRLYSDGNFMNKIELGFVDNIESELKKSANKQPISLTSILKHYTNLPVKVDDKETKLFKAGTPLAENYCDSSTLFKKIQKDLRKYVVDGEVCMTVIYSSSELIQLPTQFVRINEYSVDNEFIKLYGYKLYNEGYYFKVWILEISGTEDSLSESMKGRLRNLRINLTRIHAEKETIRILLSGIKNGKVVFAEGSKKLALIDTYLKIMAEKLFKKTRYNLEQADMLDFALQSEDVVSPGSFSSLEESIHYFSDQHTRVNIEKLLNLMNTDNKKLILFISSSPAGKNPLDFGKELKKIQDTLEASADRGNFKIEVQTGVIKNDLPSILNKKRPDYLHITLHASETDGLYFENAAGQALPMSADEFAQVLQLISKKHKPEVIVLSACNSKPHAEAVKAYCNHVIGTKAVFPERAAVVYAHRFYEMLFNDNSTDIPFCHDAAILGISQNVPPFAPVGEIPVHEIPVIYNA